MLAHCHVMNHHDPRWRAETKGGGSRSYGAGVQGTLNGVFSALNTSKSLALLLNELKVGQDSFKLVSTKALVPERA